MALSFPARPPYELTEWFDERETYDLYIETTLEDHETKVTAQGTALLDKAPLASPAFTGNPTAPTPATADNDTSVATTAFVKAQGYAPLASPALTGTPTAPTQTAGNNTTRLATTAFVQTASGLLVPKSLMDAKGDLIVATANDTPARLPVGSNGQVLTADSAQASGMKWAEGLSVPQFGPAMYLLNSPFRCIMMPGNSSASSYLTGSTIQGLPVFVGADFSVTEIGFRISTAGLAGELVRFGIYKAGNDGFASDLIWDSGAITYDSVRNITQTVELTLSSGNYWVVVCGDGTTGKFQGWRTETRGGFHPQINGAYAAVRFGSARTISDPLPASLAGITPSESDNQINNGAPAIYLQGGIL